MKLTSLFIGLSLLTSAAMADVATISKPGTSVELSGSMNGATSEIFSALADAYAAGFRDAHGADFFDQLSTPQRVGGSTKYVNKNLSARVQSGITLSYSASITAKKGEIKLANKVLTITGRAAELLKGAMSYSKDIHSGAQPVGVGRTISKTGKVVCSRVVYPNAPTTCTIKL